MKDLGARGNYRAVMEALDLGDPPNNEYIYNTAVNVMGKTGRFQEALDILKRMASDGITPDTRAYTAVINACGRAGRPSEALQLLRELQASGQEVDHMAYGATLDALAKGGGDAKIAIALLEEMMSSGLIPSPPCWSSAMSACGRAGDVDGALKLLDNMYTIGIEANLVTYNSCISACASNRRPEKALELLERMYAAGVNPDEVSYNSAINALAKSGDTEGVQQLLTKMRSAGLRISEITYTAAMTKGTGESVLRDMKLAGVEGDSRSLAKALASWPEGRGAAKRAVAELGASSTESSETDGSRRDIYACNAVLNKCAEEGAQADALALLEDMKTNGPAPSVISYTSCIAACREKGDVKAALLLLDELCSIPGMQVDVLPWNYALDVCKRGKHAKEAMRLLEKMEANAEGQQPNTVSYTLVMGAIAQKGNLSGVFKLFDRMRERNVIPDKVTFEVGLRLCGKMGSPVAVKRGLLLLGQMKKVGGLEPDRRWLEFFVGRYKENLAHEKEVQRQIEEQ